VLVAVAAAAASVSERSPLRRLPLVVPFGVNPQGTGLLLVILTGARTRQALRSSASTRALQTRVPDVPRCERSEHREPSEPRTFELSGKAQLTVEFKSHIIRSDG